MNLLKIASWNVNSIRIRLKLLALLIEQHAPDIICLQETKVENSLFPTLKPLGYNYTYINGQKSYNGMAIISKLPLKMLDHKHFVNKDSRDIAVQIKDIIIHNLYVPAGGDIPDPELNPKFAHKLDYLDSLYEHFLNIDKSEKHLSEKHLVVGDLNVAPLECDVWSHKQLLNIVSHTEIEVNKFNKWIHSAKLTDLPRLFIPAPEKLYSWWSYRNIDYKKSNRGRRLDHALACQALTPQIQNAYYLPEFRSCDSPSDHVPLIVEIKI
ncbi:exodeoxyribonuclease III [Rickettsiales endosymbiont of Stachyamoeba lipophora]|uniref:exodeoxyribonuclease III n=1 Tax=Rickettsiales endosymbiont of Stachyamoeba lipophora TaxID=2486578 RepID=UPI000F64B43E|nr:exodeoxyribonuclease III [Rickettsiales endosymbiont of Stachyamoeba lipophora]AZL15658.1 exodeoxyribonuclease III [Rickettsiales endosymbiont of Stachyamoeba lipophora]